MKQFFAAFFGTIAGLIVTFILLILITGVIFTGIISSTMEKKAFKVKNKSVLHVQLDKEIPERDPESPFENFDFVSMRRTHESGLNGILADIKAAKTDTNIRGVLLDLSIIPAGMATIEEIRNALIDFKKSNKFIVSYGEVYSQKAYYLASIADKIYINPEGWMEFKGLSAEVMFFKGTLEKLEIQAQVFRHGKFKSAIEPFILDKMSPENRMQMRTYVTALWNKILDGISSSRNISVPRLNELADSMLVAGAEEALKYNFVDGIKYKDEILDILREKLSIEKEEKINFVTFNEYDKSPAKGETKDFFQRKNKIAIVYAIGGITGGEGDKNQMGSEHISTAIRKARNDSSIKAIVLRVNSPGGSALASEVIWREVSLAQKAKPVIVSMGDVAASGGYYIACAADAIVAQPNTITGSIGVFGILPNMQKFFNNKLGITTDTVSTNKYANMGSVFRPVSSQEGLIIQQEVEKVYTTFLKHVAEGRNMSPEAVDSIGQGRVWSGIDAKRIGLVDELGGIQMAIDMASKKAKLDDYRIVELPALKDPFEEMIKKFTTEAHTYFIDKELGEEYKNFKELKSIMDAKGVQAKMLYDINIR